MREEQQEKHALECAQHIIKISRVHADEYRDSWFGGESNLAKDYMRLRNEVKSLREALAAAQRVVEAAKRVATDAVEVFGMSHYEVYGTFIHELRAAVAAETQTTPHAGGTDA